MTKEFTQTDQALANRDRIPLAGGHFSAVNLDHALKTGRINAIGSQVTDSSFLDQRFNLNADDEFSRAMATIYETAIDNFIQDPEVEALLLDPDWSMGDRIAFEAKLAEHTNQAFSYVPGLVDYRSDADVAGFPKAQEITKNLNDLSYDIRHGTMRYENDCNVMSATKGLIMQMIENDLLSAQSDNPANLKFAGNYFLAFGAVGFDPNLGAGGGHAWVMSSVTGNVIEAATDPREGMDIYLVTNSTFSDYIAGEATVARGLLHNPQDVNVYGSWGYDGIGRDEDVISQRRAAIENGQFGSLRNKTFEFIYEEDVHRVNGNYAAIYRNYQHVYVDVPQVEPARPGEEDPTIIARVTAPDANVNMLEKMWFSAAYEAYKDELGVGGSILIQTADAGRQVLVTPSASGDWEYKDITGLDFQYVPRVTYSNEMMFRTPGMDARMALAAETGVVREADNRVKVLQKSLGLTDDGIEGPNTRKAVLDYAEKNGLDPYNTGIEEFIAHVEKIPVPEMMNIPKQEEIVQKETPPEVTEEPEEEVKVEPVETSKTEVSKKEIEETSKSDELQSDEKPAVKTITTDKENIAAYTETYTVVRGDNLTKIAARFNTAVDELVTLNNIKNKNLIFPDQVLKIPGRVLDVSDLANDVRVIELLDRLGYDTDENEIENSLRQFAKEHKTAPGITPDEMVTHLEQAIADAERRDRIQEQDHTPASKGEKVPIGDSFEKAVVGEPKGPSEENPAPVAERPAPSLQGIDI